jgi:hypothetical protein
MPENKIVMQAAQRRPSMAGGSGRTILLSKTAAQYAASVRLTILLAINAQSLSEKRLSHQRSSCASRGPEYSHMDCTSLDAAAGCNAHIPQHSLYRYARGISLKENRRLSRKSRDCLTAQIRRHTDVSGNKTDCHLTGVQQQRSSARGG